MVWYWYKARKMNRWGRIESRNRSTHVCGYSANDEAAAVVHWQENFFAYSVMLDQLESIREKISSTSIIYVNLR